MTLLLGAASVVVGGFAIVHWRTRPALRCLVFLPLLWCVFPWILTDLFTIVMEERRANWRLPREAPFSGAALVMHVLTAIQAGGTAALVGAVAADLEASHE